MGSIMTGTVYVRLMYSTDGGSTWLPNSPTDLRAAQYAITVPTEVAIEQNFDYKRRIRRVMKGRPKLYLKFDADQFGQVNDASDAKLQYVEDWLRAEGLLRVFIHDGKASPTGLSPEGRTYFATSNNTYYVIPEEGAEPDIVSSFHKTFELTLMTRDTL